VSLKVPSCGIVLCLRLRLLCLRSSERNPVGLSLGFAGGPLFYFSRAPQIHNISHESDLYLHLSPAKRLTQENRVISFANIGRAERQDVPSFHCAISEHAAELAPSRAIEPE
jgi:hypothetical protein